MLRLQAPGGLGTEVGLESAGQWRQAVVCKRRLASQLMQMLHRQYHARSFTLWGVRIYMTTSPYAAGVLAANQITSCTVVIDRHVHAHHSQPSSRLLTSPISSSDASSSSAAAYTAIQVRPYALLRTRCSGPTLIGTWCDSCLAYSTNKMVPG